jgi:uncharacterized DUF497 family protein
MPITITWDKTKAGINKRKHKGTFEEAMTVFRDRNEIMISDPEHSQEEERFVCIGLSERGRIVAVVCTETEEAVHIISARPATTVERSQYEDND